MFIKRSTKYSKSNKQYQKYTRNQNMKSYKDQSIMQLFRNKFNSWKSKSQLLRDMKLLKLPKFQLKNQFTMLNIVTVRNHKLLQLKSKRQSIKNILKRLLLKNAIMFKVESKRKLYKLPAILKYQFTRKLLNNSLYSLINQFHSEQLRKDQLQQIDKFHSLLNTLLQSSSLSKSQ